MSTDHPCSSLRTTLTGAKIIKFGTKVTFTGSAKRGESGARWARYSGHDNLNDAMDKDKGGATRADINWDLAHGRLTLQDGLNANDAVNVATDADLGADQEVPFIPTITVGEQGWTTRQSPIHPSCGPSAPQMDPCEAANMTDEDLHDAYYAAARASASTQLNHMETAYMVSARSNETVAQVKTELGLPTTDSYKEALSWKAKNINHGDKWCEAFEKEVASFKRFNTFETVRRDSVPAESTIISGRFTGKIKSDAQGKPIKWKQRFVIRGFMERFGEHFFNTQTQTLSTDSAFTMLALAAGNRWHTRLIDLTAAFQHGVTDTDKTYVQMPPGFEEYDEDGTEMLYHLTGNMYGTRSAGRIFARFRDSTFFELGMTRFNHDRCCFYRKSGNDFLIVSAFVLMTAFVAATAKSTSTNSTVNSPRKLKLPQSQSTSFWE